MFNTKTINPITIINEMINLINEDFKHAQIKKEDINNIVSLSVSVFIDKLIKDKLELNSDSNTNTDMSNLIDMDYEHDNTCNNIIEKDISFKKSNELIITNLSLNSFMKSRDYGIIFLKDENISNFFLIKKEDIKDLSNYNEDYLLKDAVAIIDCNKSIYRSKPIIINNISFSEFKEIMSFIYSKINSFINKLSVEISKEINNKIIFGKIINFVEKDSYNNPNIYSDYATIEFSYNNRTYYGFCEKRHLNKYFLNRNLNNNCGSYSIVGEKNIPFVIRSVNYLKDNKRLEIQLSNNSKKVVKLLLDYFITSLGYNLSDYNYKVTRRIHSEISEIYSIGKFPKDVVDSVSKVLNNEIIKVKVISDINKITDYYNNVITFKELCNSHLNVKINKDNEKLNDDVFDNDLIQNYAENNLKLYQDTINSYKENSELYKSLVINDEFAIDESDISFGSNNDFYKDFKNKEILEENIEKQVVNISSRVNYKNYSNQKSYLKKINNPNNLNNHDYKYTYNEYINPNYVEDLISDEYITVEEKDYVSDFSYLDDDAFIYVSDNNEYSNVFDGAYFNSSSDDLSFNCINEFQENKNKDNKNKKHRLSKRERVWKKIKKINRQYSSINKEVFRNS